MDANQDRRDPNERPFSKDSAGLEDQLHLQNNGFGGAKNVRGLRMLTVGETFPRRLRPRLPQLEVDTLIPH